MEENCVMNTYGRYDVTFEKGLGCKIYDSVGQEYMDFVSGVAVNCLGHSHPAIINAITTQSSKLMQSSNYYWNTPHKLLSKKLIDNCDHDKVFFCNSGTEAIEAALKIARKYGALKTTKEKNVLIYMDESFHGRTMGSLSITGQEKYQKDFRPLIGGTQKVKFNDVEGLKKNFNDKVCAVIVEPIQGEGGINIATIEFLKAARDLCDKYDALLIFDEVQCGMGRLGSLFAYKKFSVIPDVICIAKALGGGFPIGATITNVKASAAFVPGDHGSTFGGNPLACAVGEAVLTELLDGGVIEKIDDKSAYMKERLLKIKEKYDVINEIKGIGLLIGIKINADTKEFCKSCFDKKLLVIAAGDNVVRLLPPLNITKGEIDEALDILERVISEI
ncbi:aspartate aminotransferase family protein [Clostridium estertheticum]|uniref:aspartate aminotransferase family protein n=1 Tax=Clostridium estertheticum TaxID=238834 RepID=UPI001CF59C5A|nr:aspartate aminotransferase family protein [Clostridium estertheticum]MCB2305312.1 aspartate aminotransferase family protein [Clostridium estertheticum]MCB2343750.1 aspartate aminotransferase family protein [Clostridium estertheticum]MCB2348668.1 aspartate aminotransferase family protein [Clostridium estertheticum]WAG45991.1 aspartate aminotransferase family protein [Clostridium estertheticum]